MQSRIVYVLTIAVIGGVFACGGKQDPDESDDEVIGKPPSETDDPFVVMNTPAEAEEASASGYIGPEEGEEDEQPEESTGETSASAAEAEDDEREDEPPTEDETDVSTAEEGDDEDSKAVRASKAEPPEDEKEAREPKDDDGVQCFSCVRICPASGGEGRASCGDEDRDVICGWGVHSERASARDLATAECNGALDMARRMKTWSRIDGECPEPTCR